MQKGRSGMGSHKHGVSGNAGRSPRFKFMKQLEAKIEEEERSKKNKSKLSASSIKELFGEK